MYICKIQIDYKPQLFSSRNRTTGSEHDGMMKALKECTEMANETLMEHAAFIRASAAENRYSFILWSKAMHQIQKLGIM